MDVGLHGCPPPMQPVIVPRYTVHERALYFNSTFYIASYLPPSTLFYSI